MGTLNTLTLASAIKKIRAHEISLQDLYADVDTSTQDQNKNLNAYLAINTSARKEAEDKIHSPLAGVPIAVKDNFLTMGIPTTASSKLLNGFMPPYESTVTHLLKDAGGIVYGKTNMDAWAHGSSTETSDFGSSKNPRNTEYSPGGSSGGNAATLAANMCISAIGSETAGSIRQPAAWCGVVGLKPTYGRVSRAGVVAMGSSLDSPGPMGKTVRDTAMLLNIIAGKDPYDATTGQVPVPDYTQSLSKGVRGMKVGIVYMDHPDLVGSPVDLAVTQAGKVFENLGAHVDKLDLSQTLQINKVLTPDHAIGVYTIVQRAEVSSNLARYDGIRFGHQRSAFGDEAQRRIMIGTFTLSKGYADKYYVHAQKVRSLYIENFKQLFNTYDILISSPSPGYALKIGSSENNPLFGELQDVLVEPSSLAGLPGISVPCHRNEKTNLYLGLNIMSAQWQEEKVLAAAQAFEENTDWNQWAVAERNEK